MEINTYGNPYPYTQKSIKSFITEMMERRGLDRMIAELDMLPFEQNVLDKRRTLCEKVVSLIRFSFEDDAVAGIASKIRHFYDLHYLMQDKECVEYLNSEFSIDLVNLIAHDKSEFDRPSHWKTSDVLTSPLFVDLNSIWGKVSSVYSSEVGALSYGNIPTSDEILASATILFDKVRKIIMYQDIE